MLTRYALNRRFRLRHLLCILIAVSVIYALTSAVPELLSQDPLSSSIVNGQIDVSTATNLAFSTPSFTSFETLTSAPRQSQLSDTVSVQSSPVSDRPGFHVVIAHYDEVPYFIGTWLDDLRQIPFIQELGLYVTIYTKGQSSNIEAIRSATGADAVITLPNIGREGGSYLHHILENYDDPPPFTLFAQSYLKKAQQTISGPTEGHLKDWLYTRLHERFNHQTGFLSLDRKHDICYCGHCTDMGRDDFYPLWSQFYALITGEVCQRLDGQILSFNGHFVVSRKRILARPRHLYEYLEELVNAPEDHWIHTEPEPTWFEKDKGKSIPSNPKFGHTLERLWHTLFGCDRPEQVTDCDIAGMQPEGPGGCSCND